jgi:hypothetical protein
VTPATAERTARAGAWLSELRDQAREWVTAQRPYPATARTEEYIDLLFAFGQARLGQRPAAQELLSRAAGSLAEADQAHQALLEAFRFRIEQALRAEPHREPLFRAWREAVEARDRLTLVLIDRARTELRVLEPDLRINPYRNWGASFSHFEVAVASLERILDPEELVSRVAGLMEAHGKGPGGEEAKARLLQQALGCASLATAEATRGWLGEMIPRLLAGRPVPEESAVQLEARALFNSLKAAVYYGLREEFLQIVPAVLRLVRSAGAFGGLMGVGEVLTVCVQAHRFFHLQPELSAFLDEVARQLPGEGQDVGPFGACALHLMACLAEGWYALGRADRARPVVRQTLQALPSLQPRDAGALACASAGAVRHAPADEARAHYPAILERTYAKDTFTTSSHYHIIQLKVIDAIVLSATEAFLND